MIEGILPGLAAAFTIEAMLLVVLGCIVGSFIGMVPLKESLFDELNDYVIRQQIQYDDCDIYVESKIANGDIAVPRVVNKLLKYIDCKLTFAFAK